MKITDPEIIRNGEIDLIDAVKNDLDLEAVTDILKNRLAASSLSSNGGEIIVHNNEIAFRIDFNVQLSGSLMFDRQGNYIPGTDDGASSETDLEDIIPEDLDSDISMDDIYPDSSLDQSSSFDNDTEASDNDQASEDNTLEDEELNISLPDYALDDEDAPEEETEEDLSIQDELAIDDQDDIFDDEDLIAEEPDLSDDLEPGLLDEQDSLLDCDDTEALDPLPEDEEDLLDDDIGDILKESREFWEQKKES